MMNGSTCHETGDFMELTFIWLLINKLYCIDYDFILSISFLSALKQVMVLIISEILIDYYDPVTKQDL